MKTNDEHGWLIKMVQENGVKIILGMAITAIVNMVIMLGNLWLTSKLAPLQTSINTLNVKAEKNEEVHVAYGGSIGDIDSREKALEKSIDSIQKQTDTIQSQVQQLYVHFLGR